MENMGRLLLLLGIIIAAIGLLTMVFGRLPVLRNLGGIRLDLGPVTCFFPIVASILLSVILTIVLNIILWISSRS